MDSRLRGNDGEGRSGVYCLVTLTFDSSPIKGEGDMVGVGLLSALPCGYCLKASMTTGVVGVVMLGFGGL